MKNHPETDFAVLLRGLNIPPCPSILTDLNAELRKDNCNQKRVAALIRSDVALSAAVLKIANSAGSGSSRKISSIDEALFSLGNQNLMNFVVGTFLKRTLNASQNPSMERFWDRTAHNAKVCALLTERLRGTQRDTAYLMGLFNDCGMLLMMQRYPEYRDTLRLANQSEQAFTTTEDALHGTNHATIGYLLTRSWGLSEVLCEAIRSHHEYEVLDTNADRGVSDEACTLIGINLIAEHIVNTFLNKPDEWAWQRSKALITGFFGISLTDLKDLADDVLSQYQRRAA